MNKTTKTQRQDLVERFELLYGSMCILFETVQWLNGRIIAADAIVPQTDDEIETLFVTTKELAGRLKSAIEELKSFDVKYCKLSSEINKEFGPGLVADLPPIDFDAMLKQIREIIPTQ